MFVFRDVVLRQFGQKEAWAAVQVCFQLFQTDSLQQSLRSASHCSSVTASCSSILCINNLLIPSSCQHICPAEARGCAEKHGPLCVPPCQSSPGAGAHHRATVVPPLPAGSFHHVGICTPEFSSFWWGFCSLCKHWWEGGTRHPGGQQVGTWAFHEGAGREAM